MLIFAGVTSLTGVGSGVDSDARLASWSEDTLGLAWDAGHANEVLFSSSSPSVDISPQPDGSVYGLFRMSVLAASSNGDVPRVGLRLPRRAVVETLAGVGELLVLRTVQENSEMPDNPPRRSCVKQPGVENFDDAIVFSTRAGIEWAFECTPSGLEVWVSIPNIEEGEFSRSFTDSFGVIGNAAVANLYFTIADYGGLLPTTFGKQQMNIPILDAYKFGFEGWSVLRGADVAHRGEPVVRLTGAEGTSIARTSLIPGPESVRPNGYIGMQDSYVWTIQSNDSVVIIGGEVIDADRTRIQFIVAPLIFLMAGFLLSQLANHLLRLRERRTTVSSPGRDAVTS